MLDVVVPAYNEANHLPVLVTRIERILQDLPYQPRFILVDDGSHDDTWQVICRLAEDRPGRVHGIQFSRNFGKDRALFAGLGCVSAPVCVTIDADGQHPPELIPDLLAEWRAGIRVVNGRKQVDRNGSSVTRRMLRALFNRIVTGLIRTDFSGASDYKMLDLRVVRTLLKFPEWNLFYRGITPWTGFSQSHVDFVPEKSPRASRWSLYGLLQMGISATIVHSDMIILLVLMIGLVGLGGVVLITLLFVYQIVIGTAVPAGYATLLMLLLSNLAILILGLGIITVFLKRILDEVIQRPRIIIADETGALPEPKKTGENGTAPR